MEISGVQSSITKTHDAVEFTLKVDVTNDVLDWLCENADAAWIAGRLLGHEETRKCICDILMGNDYTEISTGISRDTLLRETLLKATHEKYVSDLRRMVNRALEVAEKYQRAYWDAYHLCDENIDVRERCRINRMKGPEFFEHLENPAHDWPAVRREIEERVLAAFNDVINDDEPKAEQPKGEPEELPF